MTTKFNIVILIFMAGLMMFRVDAHATTTVGTTSEYSIDYEEPIEKEGTGNCTVLISIPYSYSDTIPKEPQKPVQTGDDSNIILYGISAILSACGMVAVGKKKI